MAEASNVLLGVGEIRMTPTDEVNKEKDIPILDDSNKIGITQECVLSNELGFKTRRVVGYFSDVKRMLVRYDLFLSFTIAEADQKNLNMLFTGGRTEGDFFIGSDVSYNNEYRIEVLFTYPDKVTSMTIIMPMCKIKSTSDMNMMNVSEPSKPAFTFQSLPVDNTIWTSLLGKISFD